MAAGEPLWSDLAREFALDVSLVQALLAQGAPHAVKDALAALAAREITVEEIAHEPATDRSAYHVAA
ncbi:ABC transporter ATP-binding protein [Bordetella pertussis]|nr:ABC transporter ATP-binding protein [Bordetella pertussis]